MNYDYIIIGSGIAGLNFALNAAKKGSVLILTKGKLHEGSTWLAQGGIAAVFDAKDSFAKHIKNTLEAGAFHNNRKTVEYIVRKAPSAILKLQNLGVNFDVAKNNRPALNLEGGHSDSRIVHCGDHTGKSIEEALIRKVRINRKISVMENAPAKDLLVKNGTCYGVRIIKKDQIRNIFGGCVVLTTGGLGQVYERTTNPHISTGDGIAMAYRAGCKLKDLEFVQFHPTALKLGKDPYFLISETLRGHGATLINEKGEKIMAGIHPLADLAPRDIISRVIFKHEMRAPVYLDAREIGKKEFMRLFPSIYEKLRAEGINPQKQPIPITPVAHYSCGGIATDLKGRTNIKRLHAFGEAACTGLHGANRLASNSLLEAAVLTENIPPAGKSIDYPEFKIPGFKRQKPRKQIIKAVRKIMWKKVGIVRTTSDLKEAYKELSELKKKLPPPSGYDAITENNILTVAMLITLAAIRRKKSLGCHNISNKVE